MSETSDLAHSQFSYVIRFYKGSLKIPTTHSGLLYAHYSENSDMLATLYSGLAFHEIVDRVPPNLLVSENPSDILSFPIHRD